MNGEMLFADVAVAVGVGVILFGCRAAPTASKSASSSDAPRQVHSAQTTSRTFTVVNLEPVAAPPIDCQILYESYQANPEAKYYPRVVDEGARASSAALCRRLRSHYPKRDDTEVTCFEGASSAQGVWALVVNSPASAVGYSKWHLAYVDIKGQVSRSRSSAGSPGGDPAIAGNDASTVPQVVGVVDYDADGSAELLTKVTGASDAAGSTFNRLSVWTVRNASVVSFGSTGEHHFIDLLDADDDGRPELLEDPYGVVVGSPLGWRRAQRPWSQLVQVAPSGALVVDGEQSRVFALNLCPQGDTLLDWLPKVEPECVAGYVHCATLWNLPIDAIETAIDRLCSRDDTSKSWCEASRHGWTRIANTKSPFALRKPTGAP